MTKKADTTPLRHPGLYLRENYLDKRGWSVSFLADALQMNRPSLSDTLNGKQGVGVRLAIRLEAAGIETAEFWFFMQARYDLHEAKKEPQPRIERIT